MQHHRTALFAALTLASCMFASCSESPRRAPVGAAAPATAPGTTSPSTGTVDESIALSGHVELAGALAAPPRMAVLFVSVKPRVDPSVRVMPALTLRIEIANAPGSSLENGVLRVPFLVTGEHTMAGGPALEASSLPSPYDVEALFDPTGGLTDLTQVVRARVPVDGPRASGLTIVLGQQ